MIVTIALGIGASAAVFSSPAQFMHFKERSDVLENVAAFTSVDLNFSRGDAGDRVTGARVSEAYFRVFRFPFVAGRGFTAQEDVPAGSAWLSVSVHSRCATL